MKKLNKILANQIEQHTESITHHDQVESVRGIQGWFNIRMSIDVMQHINRMKGERKTQMIISTKREKHMTKFNSLS